MSAWRPRFCSSTTSISRPKPCWARRSPNPDSTSTPSRWCPPNASTSPAVDVTFPDPTGYDVIVPLGARWPVYDEALRRTWVGAETQLVRDAADAGVALLGVCFGGQLLAQAFGGSVARSAGPGDRLVRRRQPTTPIWCPAGRGSNGISTGGRCRRARPRSPAPRTRRRRSCSAARWRCSSTPRSTTKLLDLWLADDRDGEVVGAGLSHDELRSRTTELADSVGDDGSAALVRGFLTHVARQPCPSS